MAKQSSSIRPHSLLLWSLVLVSLYSTTTLSAQDAQGRIFDYPFLRFEAYEFLAINSFTPTFTTTPGLEGCCADYTNDDQLSGGGGLSVVYSLSKLLHFDAALVLGGIGSTVTGEGNGTAIIRSDTIPARFYNIIEYSVPLLTLESGVRLNPAGGLMLRAGGSVGVPISPRFIARQKLIAPARYVDNDEADRESSGTLEEASSSWWGYYGAIGYEIRIGRQGEVLLTPEFAAHFSDASILTTDSWTVNTLRFGLRLSFLFHRREQKKRPEPIVVTEVDTVTERSTEVLPKADLSADIALLCFDEKGNEEECVDIKVRRIDVGSNAALLNYLFFGEGSAELPDRYRMISTEETSGFRESKIQGEALDVYYELLNIVGRRLQQFDSARLGIVGCHDGSATEVGVEGLSMNRARAVRDYLVETWGIDSARLHLSARALPEHPSRSGDRDGDAENRRVELQSVDWDILMPSVREKSLLKLSIPYLDFAPEVNSSHGVTSWSIEISQNNEVFHVLSGSGEPPPRVRWTPAEGDIPTEDPITYQLKVNDQRGASLGTPPISIDVTVLDKNASISLETYNLIIFPFDASTLSASHERIIERINTIASPTSRVDVIGYTDRIGEPDYNLNLSRERAESVAARLFYPPKTVGGLGDQVLLFNNGLPEGRFYSRTVNVRVLD